MRIIKAPGPIPADLQNSVFLAGSIEMGTAENWQEYATDILARSEYSILNPRRDDWDPSWEQSISNPQFYRQVMWELLAMEKADHILMHFVPDTKSPITLLELGLWATDDELNKLIVSCPADFWRKGNIEIVCEYYGVPLYHTLDLALATFQ